MSFELPTSKKGLTFARWILSTVKRFAGTEQRMALRKFQMFRFRKLQCLLWRILFGRNLKALSVVYGSDKWGRHWYAQHYERHFDHIRKRRINILEIGIGGYDDPEAGGASLRMWRTYFPHGRVFGIDICDKRPHEESRIKTFRGSQADEKFLLETMDIIGEVEIIIDDGSHINDHVLRTFAILFPRLSQNGIYVIEDTTTSYWEEMGGSSSDLNRVDTIMGFLKGLTDALNYAEVEGKVDQLGALGRDIAEIHFYHNIVFIQKGLNNEESMLRWR